MYDEMGLLNTLQVKMNAFAGPVFPLLSEIFPDATYMFNTRLPVGTMASYAQIVNHIPILAKVVELLTGSVFRGFATFPYDMPKAWDVYRENATSYRNIMRNRMGLQAFIHEGLLLCYAGQACSTVLRVS